MGNNIWDENKEKLYKKSIVKYIVTGLFGWLGVHKFIEKKIGIGFLYLFTLGLFLIGWIVDSIKIACEVDRLTKEKKQSTRMCPRCKSVNYSIHIEDVVIRDKKVKTTTSLNLNPLQPFTLFNHETETIRQPITTQVSKFVCNNCGKIFK